LLVALLFAAGMFTDNLRLPGEEVAVAASTGNSVPLDLSQVPPPIASSAVKFDFDGDEKADIGRWQIASNGLRVRSSSTTNNLDYSVGSYGEKFAPGDFNGDGKTDAAVFSGGTWTYKTSTTATAQTISHGTTGDIPVAADYDGDGITDAAIFRPSTNVWSIKQSSDSQIYSTTWGASGDLPVTGDYDGDGLSDFVVWRPSTGIWYLNMTTDGYYTTTWGTPASDIPVAGDFDGDDKTDIAVFRKTTGVWYIRTSTSGFANWITQSWGNVGDQPVPADYDGDGQDDYAVWRPTTGVWWLVYSGDNYSIHTYTLGESIDRAAPAAYLKQVGGAVLADELAASRLSPRNATGGTDLYSQNFSWGRNLVSLPGRAGLDLSLGISYNSLVWTKSGDEFYFDADGGNAGPGFRLGFPAIEPIYFDGAKSKFAYMMVAPSGARIEFRETAVSQVYETADSSYAQLKTIGASNPNDPVTGITIIVTTTDGTQMKYLWEAGADRFVCKEIKDRNGNFITIGYDSNGLLNTVTDTLGRVVTITNTDGYPTSITQNWKASNGEGPSTDAKTWAAFTYTNKTINTNYYGLSVIGPLNGHSLKVLDKITYLDGSSTKFTYNGYGQVYKVANIAADSPSHELNSTELDLETPTTSTDVPRFTSTSTTTEKFNDGSPSTVTVTNTAPSAAANYSLPGSISINSSVVKVAVASHPNQLYTRIHFGGSGWKEGLVLATEDCTDTGSTCDTRERWSWTDYTQDNTGLSFILNPRVIETRVGDGTNVKKTTISYRYDTPTSSYLYGLPETVTIGDLSTVLKTQTTTYNLNSDYTSRRIIGLPSETKLWEGTSSGTLMSKVTFDYDVGGYTGTGQSLTDATQHCTTTSSSCTTAYGTGFTYRGNQTSVKRWDAAAPTSEGSAVESTVVYNIAGSPISKTTPWNGTSYRTVSIGYTDVWNDGVSRTTYAYPTSITDPNSQSSTVKYRFDIGANVEATSPAPHNQTHGKKTKRVYDTYGRLQRDSVFVDTAEQSYTRYVYPDNNGNQLQVFTTLIDDPESTSGPDTADEVMTETFFDGAGRPLRTRTPHPGSIGEWSATKTEYDILGRVIGQSVPTEVSVSGSTWAPAGDDSAGYKMTYQEYDWMGRVVRKINTDGNPAASENDSDVFISYSSCGCAGGLETTIEGEKVPRTDTSGTARRKQKLYQDPLGRTTKVETFGWDGIAVYSTLAKTYNGRDQVTLSRQHVGTTSGGYQDTIISFDGHGRVYQSHRPEQRDGSTLKYTTYTYYPDDSIQSMTDGRGVVTNYEYNSRGLVTDMSWNVGSTGVTDVTDVEFEYDNVGNRTSMVDGLGEVTYAYDSLSRLTSELREFNDTLANAPESNNGFKLEYTYHIGGGLKSVTDPYGDAINYAYDQTARLDAVTGSSFGGVTTYAQNPEYRAWGGLKHLEYGNAIEADITFDSAMRPATFNLQKSGNDPVMEKAYQYYPDGKLKFVDDEVNGIFDRLQTFDHLGRIVAAKSSTEASGTPVTTDLDTNLPYRQSYDFNAFGNLTQRDNLHWGTDYWDNRLSNLSYTYENNRVTNANWAYDWDGRVIQTSGPDDWSSITYDARGMLKTLHSYHPTITTRHYDGYGREGKRERSVWVENETPPNFGEWQEEDDEYFIRSSVLGGAVVTETGPTGKKKQTFVYAAGAKIASQTEHVYESTTYKNVRFQHLDASGMSRRWSNTSGIAFADTGDYEGTPVEADPSGGNMGIETPYVTEPPEPPPPDEDFPVFSVTEIDPPIRNGMRQTTVLNGMRLIGPVANSIMESAAVPCPDNDCDPQVAIDPKTGERVITSPFVALNDGRNGYYAGKWVPDTGGQICVNGVCGDEEVTEWRREWIDSAKDTNSRDNPNCITNAVPGSRLTINRLQMIVGQGVYDQSSGKLQISDAPDNEHDGIHILHPEGNNSDGTPRTVTALPAMSGRVLHYGPHTLERLHANLDIRLNATLNGDPLVLTLKDMKFKEGAFKPGQRISAGQHLGLIEHSFLLNGELSEGSGLHVTLMTLSTYRRYVSRGGVTARSRKSVPSNKLIDAYNDPRSPFKCL